MQLHPVTLVRHLRGDLVSKLMKDFGTCSPFQMIPNSNLKMPQTMSDGSVKIQKETEVRLKIIGTLGGCH